MLNKYITKLAVWLLRHKTLSSQEKAVLLSTVLDSISSLPFHDMISSNESGRLIVNGKPVTVEMARNLRHSAKAGLDNVAIRFIREQIAFMAINIGVHNGDSPDKIMFARTALWNGQQEKLLLEKLAGQQEDDMDEDP